MQDKHFLRSIIILFVHLNMFVHLDAFCAFFNNVYLYRMQ